MVSGALSISPLKRSPARSLIGGLWALALAAGCAQPGSPSSGASGTEAAVFSGRALVMVIQIEPISLASKPLRTAGISQGMTLEMFNAGLAYVDEQEDFHPHLAESLPQLNSDSWRVFPDGGMETTYRLKPNLIWHDGTPLSAEDWVFAFRVYSNPELGLSAGLPQRNIARVEAPDPRTVVIHWKSPYPDADGLTPTALSALPRHLLEEPFQRLDGDAFAALPFWTREFVGMGPFRLSAWEPGAHIEADAWSGYLQGRPKIDRLRWVFINDQNTALANFLAGSVHAALNNIMRYQTTAILEREWAGTNGGVVLKQLTGIRRTEVQVHPERAKPAALMEVRTRRALAHAIDREGLNQALIDGQGAVAHTLIFPHVQFFPEVDRVLAKYPYDLRRTEQLLNEVGYTKGGDGVYGSPSLGRFSMEAWTLDGQQNIAELAIMADGLRRAGLDVTEYVVPAALLSDNEHRAKFPGISSTSAGAVEAMGPNNIPRPENRWAGSNRSSWMHPEYERIVARYETTLARSERNALLVQMARLYSEEIPSIPLYYNLEVLPHVSALKGVISPRVAYNAHLWEFR